MELEGMMFGSEILPWEIIFLLIQQNILLETNLKRALFVGINYNPISGKHIDYAISKV